ncbi:MAG: hypothetical protein EZS28_053153, partial [Streblomastix strix]
LVQSDQEKVEQRGRPKKYSSQEEAERIAAEQRSRAQQKYRIQRQEFRASAHDLQLLLIRRLQKTIITNLLEITLIYPSASSALSALGHKVRARIPAISSILPLDF